MELAFDLYEKLSSAEGIIDKYKEEKLDRVVIVIDCNKYLLYDKNLLSVIKQLLNEIPLENIDIFFVSIGKESS